jgi:hypothetical protein
MEAKFNPKTIIGKKILRIIRKRVMQLTQKAAMENEQCDL